MTRQRGAARWLLVVLVVLLLVGMLATLWAGKTGRVKSRHGVVGVRGAASSPATSAPSRAQGASERSSNRYWRLPNPSACARSSCTAQSIWG